MESWREDFHQKVKYKVSARCIFMLYLRDTEASCCHIPLKSHNTCISQLASSILLGCLSPSFCTGSS